MFDALRPFLSRLIGATVGALAGIVQTKVGIEIDPATQASVTAAVVLGVYGVVHRLVDKKVNPADTASKELAVEGKAAAAKGGI